MIFESTVGELGLMCFGNTLVRLRRMLPDGYSLTASKVNHTPRLWNDREKGGNVADSLCKRREQS